MNGFSCLLIQRSFLEQPRGAADPTFQRGLRRGQMEFGFLEVGGFQLGEGEAEDGSFHLLEFSDFHGDLVTCLRPSFCAISVAVLMTASANAHSCMEKTLAFCVN